MAVHRGWSALLDSRKVLEGDLAFMRQRVDDAELALPIGFDRSWCNRSRAARIRSAHDTALSGEEDPEVTVRVPAVLPLLIQNYMQTLQY